MTENKTQAAKMASASTGIQYYKLTEYRKDYYPLISLNLLKGPSYFQSTEGF